MYPRSSEAAEPPVVRPLFRRDKVAAPYRTIDYHNNLLAYPEDWPKYYNGGVLCDMLQGPCNCGAWHHLDEWQIRISGGDNGRSRSNSGTESR